jgi:hypothetical protein
VNLADFFVGAANVPVDASRMGRQFARMGKRLAIEFLLATLIGLVLGLIGPFGTFEMPAAARIAYWVIFGIVGYAIFRPLGIVGGWLSEVLGLSRIIGVGLSLVVAALPMTLIVAALIWKFDLGAMLRWKGLPGLYFQVWLIGFLTHGFFALVFRNRGEAAPAASVAYYAEAEPAARFEDRLPAGFGALLALKGEDHYVRAIGVSREELILIRLRDAIAELGGVPGLQVHRSWWVARDGVAKINRQARAMTLTLTNGLDVPVARDQIARVKSEGWKG